MREPLVPWVRWRKLVAWLESRGVSTYRLKERRAALKGEPEHVVHGRLLPGSRRALYDWRGVSAYFGVPAEPKYFPTTQTTKSTLRS